MKKLLPIIMLAVVACNNKKDDPKPQKAIKLSVENNSDIPFLAIEIGTGDEPSTGKNNWNINGKGTFDTILNYEVGTKLFLRAWSADTKWALKITKDISTKTVNLKTSIPGKPYDPLTGYVQNQGSNDTQLYFGVVRDTIK